MASAAQPHFISVEQYLRTPFRPDVDYVEGILEERNLGEMDHGTLQGVLYTLFFSQRRAWKIWPALDTRMQVSAHRYRVPDLSIIHPEHRAEQIIRTPPLLCIEILSPEDTLRKMLTRVQDYFHMGVPHVWIFDPATRAVFICHEDGSSTEQTTGALTLPDTAIAVDLATIFQPLDED